ncbi:TonB-dependent receptor [Pedobacter sp. UBA5917]|uniref:TonB-dependent receptor n=1 Tax=Pedobacter sp. UBA5917 TaxID=1947061 RepID=UPI0025D282B9|nr:TonB-dependent receptor [Pedobacter sp. UBA5917]
MGKFLKFFIVFIICCYASVASAQNVVIKGKVVDGKNQPLEFATVFCEETQLYAFTDQKGVFSISVPSSLNQISLRFTAVGKKSVERKVEKKDFLEKIDIILIENSLTLSDIEVYATYSKSKNSISSITFDEEAIERIQAFSLMDVLNTLPGKQLVAPNINIAQTLTLRNTLGGTYDLNNSLGIPIIVDGIRLSNDANMQSRPATQWGMGAVVPATNSGSATDVPFRGIDLREIPVESIEKIEVIQGVASAEYGELTDGAILIERKAGKSPLQFTTNINAGSYNYSLNKGFNLPGKMGGLTTDFNYAISNDNPTDNFQEYRRYGAALRWQYNVNSFIRNKFSVDYNRKLDINKIDPDDGSRREYYSKQEGIRLSNTTDFKISSRYVNNVNLTLSYSETNQESYSQWFLNQAAKGYTAKDTTGIYKGIVLGGQYLAVEEIIGNPITASGNLKFISFFNLSNSRHNLSYGINVNYTNNGGKGIISDPDRPRFVNYNSTNVRPYSFELNPSIINSGFYFTDNITYKLFEKKITSNLGVRFDSQNGSLSIQPRLSTQVNLSKEWNVGLAYGISSKSPTLAHQYPPPAWIDIPLIFALNTEAALYLVYTQKFQAANPDLKPSKSNQAEFTLNFTNKTFSSRLNVFYKGARNGFSNVRQYQQFVLPNYNYSYDASLKQIVYQENGTYTPYFGNSFYTISNLSNSDTYGFDWSINFSKIQAINTNISTSTSYILSQENNPILDAIYLATPVVINGKNINYALFKPLTNDKKYVITSKLNTTTHIPKLGFVVMTNTDIFWANRRKSKYNDKLQQASGYLDQNLQTILFNDGQANPIPPRNLSLSNSDQQLVYANFSLSVAKEINKRIRIAITAYNTFNIRPEYTVVNPDTNVPVTTVYNSPLSITGGISLKL